MRYTSFVCVAVRKNQTETLQTAIAKMPNPLPISPATNRILIKPSIYDPTLPGNSSLGMVRATIEFFKAVAPISLIESDNPIRQADEAFSRCNYDSLVDDRVNLVNLSKEPLFLCAMAGYHLEQVLLPQILLQHDFLINLATAKTQERITIGACIKNLFGLLPETNKSSLHPYLSDVLIDLLLFFKPKLNIIDLTYLIEGERTIGKVHEVGGIILGTDPVAVDAYCAHLLGFDPLKIGYIKKAYDLGIGEALLERIQVFGTEHQKEQLVARCSI